MLDRMSDEVQASNGRATRSTGSPSPTGPWSSGRISAGWARPWSRRATRSVAGRDSQLGLLGRGHASRSTEPSRTALGPRSEDWLDGGRGRSECRRGHHAVVAMPRRRDCSMPWRSHVRPRSSAIAPAVDGELPESSVHRAVQRLPDVRPDQPDPWRLRRPVRRVPGGACRGRDVRQASRGRGCSPRHPTRRRHRRLRCGTQRERAARVRRSRAPAPPAEDGASGPGQRITPGRA